MHRAFVLLAICGCGDLDGPEIVGIRPTVGSPGDMVEIDGNRLCGQMSDVTEGGLCDPLPSAYVSFGIDPQIDGQVVTWRNEYAEVFVPGGPLGSVQVVLTVDGRTSNGVWFEVE